MGQRKRKRGLGRGVDRLQSRRSQKQRNGLWTPEKCGDFGLRHRVSSAMGELSEAVDPPCEPEVFMWDCLLWGQRDATWLEETCEDCFLWSKWLEHHVEG